MILTGKKIVLLPVENDLTHGADIVTLAVDNGTKTISISKTNNLHISILGHDATKRSSEVIVSGSDPRGVGLLFKQYYYPER